MNKKTLIILGIIVGALLITLLVFFSLQKDTRIENTGTTTPNETRGDSIVIKTERGDSLEINNFIDNEETFEVDTENPTYVFAGDELGRTDKGFQILFYRETNQFLINLYSEPLKDTRAQAETELLVKTGLTRSEVCSLNLFVGTDFETNPDLANKDLGLSFCSGSLEL